jgi:hypothetical protein
MKISEEIRAKFGSGEAEAGMADKAREFVEQGGEVYR